MVFGTYNIILDNTPSLGQSLLYNTLSRSCYMLPTPTCAELRYGRIPSELGEEDIQKLHTRLILVEDRDVEKSILLYRVNEQRYAGGTVNLTVYTTYRCNFGCIYCYEKDSNVLDSAEMSRATVDNLFEWLSTYVEDRNVGRLNLELYGGEPLCNMPIVRYLVQRADEFIAARNMAIETFLVTNGSLLTSEVVSLLRRINLGQVQVTLDGCREHHDRRRPFKNGQPSYDAIVENLRSLAGVCPLVLRINVDQDVLAKPEPVFQLVDDLTSVGIPQSVETIIQASSVFHWDWSCGHLDYTIDYKQLRDFRLTLYRYAMSKGFAILHPLRNAPCFAITTGSFSVDPHGNIYACSFLVGKSEYRIGSVTEHEFTPMYFRMQTAQPWDDECLGCCYFPVCLGGCRAHTLLEGRGISSKLCAKEFYERAVVPFLELYYAGAGK